MAWGAIVGGALAAAGALGAAQSGKGKDGKLYQQAANEFASLRVPTAAEMEVELQKLVSQGQITPEEAQAILVDRTAYEGIDYEAGPGREAELQAMNELGEIYRQGGLTDVDRARLEDIKSETAGAATGTREALMQKFQERGISGSGLELAEQLSGQEAAIAEAAKSGRDVAADAEMRALQALMASGEMGAGLSQTDFAKQSQIASAKDAMEQFNAANRQIIERENVGRRQTAQEQNLRERQRLHETNVQQENMNRIRDAELKQQQYENELAKRKGTAAAYTGAAQSETERAKSQQDMYGNLIGAGGQIIAASDRDKD